MITNEEELAVVRAQRSRVESALDSLRRDIRPKNETMYQQMAEGYLEMLASLQSEIDSYIGITPSIPTASQPMSKVS